MGKPGAYETGWERIFGGGATPEEDRILKEMVRRQAPTCGGEDGCTNPPDEEHTCPYQEEINGNSEFTCTCCAECRTACVWAI